MNQNRLYTTKFQAGLGLVEETKALLEIWKPGMSRQNLIATSLQAGAFPNVSARRLRNLISECFAYRYLVEGDAPARDLKRLSAHLRKSEFRQLLLIYTCRANAVLADFIETVYWERYSAGYIELGTKDSKEFIERALDEEKMEKRWTESVVKRVSSYLIGCCADYGMLEEKRSSSRKFLTFRIEEPTFVYLAYKLHFSGIGDNALLEHQDWRLFGMNRDNVIDEFKRLVTNDVFIFQAAGNAVNISWKYKDMEEVCDVLAES